MNVWRRALILLSGLTGAAGVALAAWASHRGGGDVLTTAALFLMIHAGPAAALALAPPRRALLAAASILLAGAILFGGDLALRFGAGLRPLPVAAPTGGVLMILGWLWLGCAGLFAGFDAGADK